MELLRRPGMAAGACPSPACRQGLTGKKRGPLPPCRGRPRVTLGRRPTRWQGRFNHESPHALGLLTTPSEWQALTSRLSDPTGSIFPCYSRGARQWERQKPFLQPLLRGAAFSIGPSSGERPLPRRRKARKAFGVRPEPIPNIRRSFPRRGPCRLPAAEVPRRGQTGLRRSEPESGFVARSPACSRRFPARPPV